MVGEDDGEEEGYHSSSSDEITEEAVAAGARGGGTSAIVPLPVIPAGLKALSKGRHDLQVPKAATYDVVRVRGHAGVEGHEKQTHSMRFSTPQKSAEAPNALGRHPHKRGRHI